MLSAAMAAEGKVGLKLNVSRDKLDAVLAILPSLHGPTVAPLAGDEWVAVDTILDEREVRKLIPRLKDTGASGIVEYPLSKIVP